MSDTERPRMTRPLAVVGAASSAGGYGPGHELAPTALRRHGLIEALAAGGRAVSDAGDVARVRHRPDPTRPEAPNVALVREVAEAVAGHVADALARAQDVLVLGGDCTVEIGTVAGALADGSGVGLVYVDLDGDFNTPATGSGALDWMGVAHLLGVEGVVPELAEIGPRTPLLPPTAVHLVGVDNLTAPERRLVEELGVGCASLAAVQEDPAAVVRDLAVWAGDFDRVLVHVDIDVLHYPSFPIAYEVRDRPGLSIEQLDDLLHRLRQLPGWTALTLCEVDPDHATDLDAQLDRLVAMVARATAPS